MSKVDTTAVQDDDVVEITNLLDCTCGYIVELTGVRRSLPAHASFKVKASELRELNYQLGGQEILKNYIRVNNSALAKEFGVDVDDTPEYNWGRDEVKSCLESDDINILLDALDFAPAGIKQLIADMAVELEISDVNKRQAISKAMGIDVDSIIANKHVFDKAEETEEKPKTTRRRTTKSATTTKTRRVKKTEDTAAAEATEE